MTQALTVSADLPALLHIGPRLLLPDLLERKVPIVADLAKPLTSDHERDERVHADSALM